ncbi:MAG: oligosaccharide flippase family protein [Cyclobacteriaceae bacterium]
MIKGLLTSKLFLESAFYGSATAINRGLVLLALPFLGSFLTIEEYGIWTLSQVLISLIAPVLCLNGSAGIMREGANDRDLGFSIFVKYVRLATKIAFVVCIVSVFLKGDWILYTIYLTLLEAYLTLLISFYRSQDKHSLYFIAVLTKLVALFIAIYFSKTHDSLISLLQYQLAFGVGLLAPLFTLTLLNDRLKSLKYEFSPVVIFSLNLLPHGIAQWILSGSDRLIIKSILGDSQLGYYSLAYTLSMSVMLVNSGLGMTIPVEIIRNYSRWVETDRRSRIILAYSILFLFISIGLMVTCLELKNNVPFLKDFNDVVAITMIWVLNGMYFLGIYLFYVNYLFYLRKSLQVSFLTAGAAIINIILTVWLVNLFGIEGAAVSTCISYLIYMGLTMGFANHLQAFPKRYFIFDMVVIGATASLNYFILRLIV